MNSYPENKGKDRSIILFKKDKDDSTNASEHRSTEAQKHEICPRFKNLIFLNKLPKSFLFA